MMAAELKGAESKEAQVVKKRKSPPIDAQQALATAHAQAAAKLDALVAAPCRQDALDAIALCRRAAALATKAHEMRQKAVVKEKAAVVKAKEAAKRKALAQKAAQQKKLEAKRQKALDAKLGRRAVSNAAIVGAVAAVQE